MICVADVRQLSTQRAAVYQTVSLPESASRERSCAHGRLNSPVTSAALCLRT